MSLPTKSAAYTDCYALYEAAAAHPNGVRQIFPDKKQADFFQLRLHQARAILQSQSRRAYPPDSPLHDTSEFDSLQAQVRGPDADGNWWVYVRPHGIPLDYEPIDPADPINLPKRDSAPTQLQLEHQKETDLA